MSVPVHRQIWLGPEQRPLVGWLCLPDDRRARGAMLLSPAIGDEARATRRTFRVLAERLAEHGTATLRLDCDGVGDSAGGFGDPDPAQRWLASVREGLAFLHDSGYRRVGAIGMRLGATLLATVAAEPQGGPDALGDLADLVLWDPAPSGAAFLREGEALYAFGDRPTPTPVPGRKHTPGFHFDAANVASLRTLDLAALPQPPRAGRMLLLTRDDRPFPRRAAQTLAGPHVVSGAATGQALLLDVPPSEATVPEASLAEVVAWVAAGPIAADAPRPVAVPEERPARFPTVHPVSGATVAVREHTRRFPVGATGGAVYGMVTEPATGAPGAPWLVFVNVALTDHTGPGRQWVDLARRFAADGFRCVRIDLSGVGESEPHPGRPANRLYSPAWLADGPAVARALAADGAPVAFVGICSGAYTALETATATTAVDAVIGINASITLYDGAPGGPAYSPARRAARIPFGVLGRLARRHRNLAGALWRIWRQVAFWNAPIAPLRRIAARGTTLYLASNAHDLLPFREVAAWWPVERLRPLRDRLQLMHEEDLDHPVLTLAGRERAAELIAGFVHERYADRSRPEPAIPRQRAVRAEPPPPPERPSAPIGALSPPA